MILHRPGDGHPERHVQARRDVVGVDSLHDVLGGRAQVAREALRAQVRVALAAGIEDGAVVVDAA